MVVMAIARELQKELLAARQREASAEFGLPIAGAAVAVQRQRSGIRRELRVEYHKPPRMVVGVDGV